MDKIILKAQNREKLDEMIKRTITLNDDETLKVNVIKNPKKILFFSIEGIYEIEIVKKSEMVKNTEKNKKEENERTNNANRNVSGSTRSNESRKENKAPERKNDRRKTEKQDSRKENRRFLNKQEKPEKSDFKNSKSSNMSGGNATGIKVQQQAVQETGDGTDSNYDKIRAFMKEFIVNSKLDLTIVSIEKISDRYIINVDGKDIRYLIGEKGSTLNSVEYLLSSVKQFKNMKVVIDSNNYKEKREESLRDLARKKGKKVLDTGRPVKLNPMSARERKIIHEEVSFIKGLKTESVGEEPKRYLVIKKARD